MPTINQKNINEHRLIKNMLTTIKPFLDRDDRLIIFFDLYFNSLMLKNIILGYVYHIGKQTIDFDIILDMSNKHILVEISRKNANYKLSKI